jgi:catechol 2,3-dioxygenase-like lactoylglutathione lyase family enzyme
MNLNQVTVPTINLEKSVDFYKKLGLRLIVKAAPRYARFECPNGEATFSIHLTEKLPSGVGVVVYFECENLDEKVADLQEIGIEFTELPNDKSWLWREAHLNDLDGNRLILFWGGKSRKFPPWRI